MMDAKQSRWCFQLIWVCVSVYGSTILVVVRFVSFRSMHSRHALRDFASDLNLEKYEQDEIRVIESKVGPDDVSLLIAFTRSPEVYEQPQVSKKQADEGGKVTEGELCTMMRLLLAVAVSSGAPLDVRVAWSFCFV